MTSEGIGKLGWTGGLVGELAVHWFRGWQGSAYWSSTLRLWRWRGAYPFDTSTKVATISGTDGSQSGDALPSLMMLRCVYSVGPTVEDWTERSEGRQSGGEQVAVRKQAMRVCDASAGESGSRVETQGYSAYYSTVIVIIIFTYS